MLSLLDCSIVIKQLSYISWQYQYFETTIFTEINAIHRRHLGVAL